MMIILGSTGRLGKHLSKEFPGALKPTHEDLDITSYKSVLSYVKRNKPDTVFHGAAWVDVRGCEMDHEKAWKVNVEGAMNVVKAIMEVSRDCYFIYPSTACVFRGDRGGYTEDDTPNPINFYGLTKLIGEYIANRLPNSLILRTDFVDRAKWRYEGAFVDRYSTSVFADTLARGIRKLIEERKMGLIHLAGKRRISHYDLAKITTPDVKPIKLSSMDIPLPRDQSLKSLRGGAILELEY